MNADRVRLCVAVLISIAVHGAIASFGGDSAGRAADSTRGLPVAVTIASVVQTEIQQSVDALTSPKRQQEPRLQELNSDGVQSAKTELSVPAKVVPELTPPTRSSQSVSNADAARESSPTESADMVRKPTSEPHQARRIETVVSASAEKSLKTPIANSLVGTGDSETIKRLHVPVIPDITAVPLYRLIPKPAYPSRSRDLGEEGRVIIAVLVSHEGNVLNAYVSESSGYPLLDGSALTTVIEKWRFKPGMRRGKAVPSWVRVPINFSIKGSL